jgi:hypothetical protein
MSSKCAINYLTILNNSESNDESSFKLIDNLFERFSKFHGTVNENCLGIFNEFVPIPYGFNQAHTLTEKMREELVNLYGTYNQFEWCKKNWGTKWDAFDVVVNIVDNELIFSTIEGPPDKFLKEFSRMFPEHKIINVVKIVEKDNFDNYKRDLEIYTLYMYKGEIRKVSFENLFRTS